MRKFIGSPRGLMTEGLVLAVLFVCLLLKNTGGQVSSQNAAAAEGERVGFAESSGDSGSAATGSTSEETGSTGGSAQEAEKKDYIKWVEFDVTSEALSHACSYDVDTYGQDVHLDWISLLAYLGAKYGGDFSSYKASDMDALAEKLINKETTMEALTKDMKYYSYYKEAYDAVLGGMVGEYEVEEAAVGTGTAGAEVTDGGAGGNESNVGASNGGGSAGAGNESTSDDSSAAGSSESRDDNDARGSAAGTSWKTVYGLKAYSPIAKTFPYSDFDDFGVSRSYGYRRNHLGHDMMGQVGTPIIAVESGYVAALGWNQYGGWRIGINSFDGKRYYYYAHLRQNRPYADGLKEGDIVQAGDVIGYMGRTGYSKNENVNNIDTSHLHFGLQLIFDESQREGNNEIWVSGYELVKFLYKHQSEVVRDDETKEWSRVVQIRDPAVEVYKSTLK